jgi:hypothetical protein
MDLTEKNIEKLFAELQGKKISIRPSKMHLGSAQNFAGWEAAMKQAVYSAKKITGKKTGHLYEELAKAAGFNNYAAMRAAVQQLFKD